MKSKHFFFFLNQCVHTGSLIITTLSSFSGLFLVGLLHLSLCLFLSFLFFFMPISASSFLIIMTWLVLEVLMVELRREVGVEERGSDEGGVDEVEERRGLVSLLLQDC